MSPGLYVAAAVLGLALGATLALLAHALFSK
jgi:hypothetical protein